MKKVIDVRGLVAFLEVCPVASGHASLKAKAVEDRRTGWRAAMRAVKEYVEEASYMVEEVEPQGPKEVKP